MLDLHVGRGAHIQSAAHGVRAVVGDLEVLEPDALQRVDKRVDRPVAVALDALFLTVIENGRLAFHQAALAHLVDEFVVGHIQRAGNIDELAEEGVADLMVKKPGLSFIHVSGAHTAQNGFYETVRANTNKRAREAIAARGMDQFQIVLLDALP